MITKSCANCGASFEVKPARAATAKFCSNSCRGQATSMFAPQCQPKGIKKACETCGNSFTVRPYRAETARFCSGTCRAKWVSTLPSSCCAKGDKPHLRNNKFRAGLMPANAFETGHKPWNRDLKGIHLSPASEFKPGERPDKRAEIGAISIRRTHDGNLRAFVKVAHPNKWKLRSTKIWEDANGPVPYGNIVHHEDRDPLNDVISNLRCLTKSEHAFEHRHDLTAARWPNSVSS
jgi:hypothetical protein